MRNLLLLSLLLISSLATLGAQENFTCYTEEPSRLIPTELLQAVPESAVPSFCQFVEVDYLIIENMGLLAATAHVIDIMEKSVQLWAVDGIVMEYELFFWNAPSPYSGSTSSQYLQSFGANRLPSDADVQHLLIWQGGGGVAYLDQLGENFNYCVSGIYDTSAPWPLYNWNPMVVTHEAGHVVGSPHTHSCTWPGGALDSCPGFTEGNCVNPGAPAGGDGTVMSYCHLSQWGINFLVGFNPTVETLLKNKLIAHNSTCEVSPPPPPGGDCDEYEVVVTLNLDAYPSETSWVIIDEGTNEVAQSPAYSKEDALSVQIDTLCLPEGCYEFIISDSDGMTGTQCGDGSFLVEKPDGLIISGGEFSGSVGTVFCLGEQVECELPGFAGLAPYANQHGGGNTTIENDVLHLFGNTWQAKYYPYEITENTVLTLDLKVVNEGEIHAIGLVPSNVFLSYQFTFKLSGTQFWGNQAFFDGIVSTGYRSYELPIGQLYAQMEALGTYDYLLFVNDKDIGVQNNEAYWRNVELCEYPSDQLPELPPVVAFTTMSEEGPASIRPRPWPNPATNRVNLHAMTDYRLMNLSGQCLKSGCSNQVDISDQPAGVYLLQYAGRVERIVKQ